MALSIQTLLVDPNPAFRHAMVRFLAYIPQLYIIGQLSNPAPTAREIAACHPDLVLLDLGGPNLANLALARAIRAVPAPPRVVLLTTSNLPEYQALGLAVADGVVDKVDFGTAIVPLLGQLFPALTAATEDPP